MEPFPTVNFVTRYQNVLVYDVDDIEWVFLIGNSNQEIQCYVAKLSVENGSEGLTECKPDFKIRTLGILCVKTKCYHFQNI